MGAECQHPGAVSPRKGHWLAGRDHPGEKTPNPLRAWNRDL